MRRLLASVMLAGLALSYGAPIWGGATDDCPPVTGTESAQLVGTTAANCDHGSAAGCVTMLGCTASAPAIQVRCTDFAAPNSITGSDPIQAAALGDSYRTGPPTPPPNLI